MADTNLTSLDPVLKTLYKGGLQNSVYKHFPLFAVIPKAEGFVGLAVCQQGNKSLHIAA